MEGLAFGGGGKVGRSFFQTEDKIEVYINYKNDMNNKSENPDCDKTNLNLRQGIGQSVKWSTAYSMF